MGSSLQIAIISSALVLVDHLPVIVHIVFSCGTAWYVFACSVVVLFPAYIHSQLKECHERLHNCLSWKLSIRTRFKASNLLKKFECLKVFTLADAATITFDSYRGVCSPLLKVIM